MNKNCDSKLKELRAMIERHKLDSLNKQSDLWTKKNVLLANHDKNSYLVLKSSRVDFEKIVQLIYKNKTLKDNYHISEVEKAILEDILNGDDNFKDFNNLFKEKPVEFLCIKKIEGFKYDKDRLGGFLFFNNEKKLFNAIKKVQEVNEIRMHKSFYQNITSPCIGIIIKTIGIKQAEEKANMKFNQLENIIQFMSGLKWNEFYPQITSNISFKKLNHSNIFSKKDNNARTSANIMPYEIHDLNDYQDESRKKIWALLEKYNRSDFEEKIIRCITWIGKGMRNQDNTMAFLQMIISLETLLIADSKDFLTESITEKMASSIAYILSTSCNERINIVKEVKYFYSLRSKVVHVSKTSIADIDLRNLFSICMNVIYSFLMIEELKNIKTNDDYYTWYLNKKYS